uniref:Uncharacterized protein n=1 Tax=Panstrongylus lignarius TaxID=156445 RepID=A0A224XP73_9HEMI
MIMFLLLLLLATLLIYEEKQKKDDCEEQENFDVVLEDMINQLHCNQLEILKNKSSSLVLLNTMHNLIKSMKDNYEAKLMRLENELQKLETLNKNIELQMNKCNEGIGNFENLCDPVNKEKLQDYLNNFKIERDSSKNIPSKLAKDKQENKEFLGTDCKQVEDENINLEIQDWECPAFDLEQEMMKSPILRSMLEKTKKEENPCFPCERKTSNPSNSTFRIYEFSSQDLDCAPANDCDNINAMKQFQSRPKRQQNKAKTSNCCEDTELMKFIKRNCNSSVLSNMSKLSKYSSAPKEKPTTRGVQQRSRSAASKVRFSEDMPNYRRYEGNSSQRNTSVQNLLWYSGPYISRSLEKEKPCPPLYEFKLKNQRTRDTCCTQEPVDLQSFLTSTHLDNMHDIVPGAGSSDYMDGDLDQMNFDCFY